MKKAAGNDCDQRLRIDPILESKAPDTATKSLSVLRVFNGSACLKQPMRDRARGWSYQIVLLIGQH